jgi:hypothetical protein
LFITRGGASGDLTNHSAIVLPPVNREAEMNVENDDSDHNFYHSKSKTEVVSQTTDFAGHVRLEV